jgi:hypothetical protein
MTTARMIEYRITRDLVQRREHANRHRSVDRLIKALAVLAGVTIVAVCLPQLVLPFFVASMVFTLGL